MFSKPKNRRKPKARSYAIQSVAGGICVLVLVCFTAFVSGMSPWHPPAPRFACVDAPATAIVVSDAAPVSEAQWREAQAQIVEEIDQDIDPGRRVVIHRATGDRRVSLGEPLADQCLDFEPGATDGRVANRRAAVLAELAHAVAALLPGAVERPQLAMTEAARQVARDLPRRGVIADRIVYVGIGPIQPGPGQLDGSGPELAYLRLSRSYAEDAATPDPRERIVSSFLPQPRDPDSSCLEDGVDGFVAVAVDVSDRLDPTYARTEIRKAVAGAFDTLRAERRVDLFYIGTGPNAESEPLWSACLDGRDGNDLAEAGLAALEKTFGPPDAWDEDRSEIAERLINQGRFWHDELRPEKLVIVSNWLQHSAAVAYGSNAKADYALVRENLRNAGYEPAGALDGVALEAVWLRTEVWKQHQTDAHARFVKALLDELAAPAAQITATKSP